MKKIISILLLSIAVCQMVWAQEPTLYNVVCNESDMGVVYAYPTQAPAGTTVMLKAEPNDGYEFVEYMVLNMTDFSPITVSENGTFEMPESDVSVSAMYSPKSYTIYIEQKSEYGRVTTYPSETATAGSVVTVAFAPLHVEGPKQWHCRGIRPLRYVCSESVRGRVQR